MYVAVIRSGEGRGKGVVLLCAEGPEEREPGTGQPDDRTGLLEGNRLRPADTESGGLEAPPWVEEDVGVLSGSSAARHQD